MSYPDHVRCTLPPPLSICCKNSRLSWILDKVMFKLSPLVRRRTQRQQPVKHKFAHRIASRRGTCSLPASSNLRTNLAPANLPLLPHRRCPPKFAKMAAPPSRTRNMIEWNSGLHVGEHCTALEALLQRSAHSKWKHSRY